MIPVNLQKLLDAKEGEHCEFKEYKNRRDFDELVKYLCALANRGGGSMVCGVTDKRPRRIVGTSAFPQPEEERRKLKDRLGLNIDFHLHHDEDGQVVVFTTPSRPVGMPVQDRGSHNGVIWWRDGDNLIPMPVDVLNAIFLESGRDFSADICPGAALKDLDENAINVFRQKWAQNKEKSEYLNVSDGQLLLDAGVVMPGGGVTYAALVLFGRPRPLERFLAQCEVIFEYRSTNTPGKAQERVNLRQGFFSWHDELWRLVNLRNDRQSYQSGFFVMDVPTFEERTVREAVMNAVCHRNYQLAGSVFVTQYPKKLVVDSPGGFPFGITVENILTRQSSRNRLIAEQLERCGLVERAGQGMDLMFRTCLRQSKAPPDFSGTDSHHVRLTLDGLVKDQKLLAMMERIGNETLNYFVPEDFMAVDAIHQERSLPEPLRERIPHLIDLGVVERAGKGKLILSRRYYTEAGQKGTYTRKRGLDRETHNALLTRHITENATDGSRLSELCQVLPALSVAQVQALLREMKTAGTIRIVGNTRAGKWLPGN